MPSKLGPHAIRPTPEVVDWARVAPVVKCLDDTTALRQATRATVRIFRRYFPDQQLGVPGGALIDAVLSSLGDAPATHVELYNETAQRLGQGLERYVDLTREAVARLRERRPDLTLVAFCFSTGNPEPEDWAYLRQHEYGGASVIGLHEYWGTQGFTGWNALRYRKVHEWTGGDHPLLLVTECGRDKVEGGKGGWHADGLSQEAYLAELLAYEGELMRDPYVIAATPFTGGPTPDWRAFDTDPISGRLAAQSGPLPAPPPAPIPPQEAPVLPDWYPPAVRRPIGVNYTPGRAGRVPLLLVDHVAEGNGDPFDWFNTLRVDPDGTDRGSSAHFWVSRTGAVVQYRPLGDTCWANGPKCQPDLSNPVIKDLIGELVGMNSVTVAIEHAGFTGQPLTQKQIAASRALHRWLSTALTIPLDRTHVIGHYQIDRCTRANCPGATHPWQEILMPDPTPTNVDALRDQTYALAHQIRGLKAKWQAAGYPQVAEGLDAAANAAERFISVSKGEK